VKSFGKVLRLANCLRLLFLAVVSAGKPLVVLFVCAQTISAEENQSSDSSDSDSPLAMLPAGEPVKGIKVPFYDTDGTTLQMTLSAGEAMRLNDVHVELRDLSIAAESDDGSRLIVEFPKSVFNVETRVLLGDEGVIIRREDFEIYGDAAEFDLRSRLGKVKGNVKMTIFKFLESE